MFVLATARNQRIFSERSGENDRLHRVAIPNIARTLGVHLQGTQGYSRSALLQALDNADAEGVKPKDATGVIPKIMGASGQATRTIPASNPPGTDAGSLSLVIG